MNHVLVVDDETEIRTSLEEILTEEGYGVATAATASEALVLLEDAPYDVVLLDIWLPDRDGMDVLSDIRQLDSEARPEVIIKDMKFDPATLKIKVGETVVWILRDEGSNADDAQKIAMQLGRAGRDGGLREGQKLRIPVVQQDSNLSNTAAPSAAEVNKQ